MKKTLLLSIVASTMIFAGGDIAPVEPAVVAPVAPVAESGWKFSGQGVVFYQTDDDWGDYNLFDKESSFINTGLQLTATNDNLIGGVGVGVQLNGLGTFGLDESLASYPMQTAGDDTFNGAYISQLYLTYGIGNTSLKVGRQELPKSLSPFAYSEDWNVFKNTFDAALVVNTDIPNTTLVGAWVRDANQNINRDDADYSNMNDFNKVNGNDGIWMITAQNKSIDNLTLTGSYYYAPNYSNNFWWLAPNKDLNILWVDAGYDAGFVNIGIQGGAVMCDIFDTNTKAFGAKVSGKINIVNASLAYSHVNDSDLGIFQVGGTTSALYTDMIGNESFYISGDRDTDKFVIRADANVFGGNLAGAYGYTDLGNSWWSYKGQRNEFDLTYSINIIKDLDITTSYIYLNDSDINPSADTVNAIRFVARYNF